MSEVLCLFVGLIIGMLFGAYLTVQSEKQAVAAGITRIGDKAYRLVPVEPAR